MKDTLEAIIHNVTLLVVVIWGFYILSSLTNHYHERAMYVLQHPHCEVLAGKEVKVK